MSAKAQEMRRAEAPGLKVIEGGRAPRTADRREVVAEILSDGTVRVGHGEPESREDGFAVGQMAGDGWTMWWERRDW